MTTDKTVFTQTAGGIDWHCEQRGKKGTDVVLIPSGEGDCAVFDTVAEDLARDFRVTTFDTPGFSRSSAPVDLEAISTATLGEQIAALLRSLEIDSATVYGCSSGGLAVLDLVVGHPELVTRAVVHEVALAATEGEALPPFLVALTTIDDAAIPEAAAAVYATVFNENEALWNALGRDYHFRLRKNYVTWVRRYIMGRQHAPVDPAALAGRPLVWTLGGLTPVAALIDNIQVAHRAGIELGVLPSRHFPQVSIPEVLAAHIRACAIAADS